MGWLAGTRPSDLGIRDGRLKAAPQTPNAVSSQVAESSSAYIRPLAVAGSASAWFGRLKEVVATQKGAKVITSTPEYLYAEFSSPLLGFVDDVEFQLDAGAGVVHVRSASRLGLSDLGANRRRIEAIRARM